MMGHYTTRADASSGSPVSFIRLSNRGRGGVCWRGTGTRVLYRRLQPSGKRPTATWEFVSGSLAALPKAFWAAGK
mgnify:CR=1 FL=1